MNLAQRIIVFSGLAGLLHSSIVPPVQQSGGDVCRYHEFVERSWPFTRAYGVAGADTVALLSEYGIIASVTVAAYLIAGILSNKNSG